MKITGTFLDEISHDIPHQNWGPEEWARDFDAMREIGIDEVYLIRCGYKRQTAFPSEQQGVQSPGGWKGHSGLPTSSHLPSKLWATPQGFSMRGLVP